MFAKSDITDIQLDERTLCLTYDDGPGIHTEEIGRFLYEQGVRATFFVVGKFAVDHPEILEKLHAWNHIIGNHTYEHPDMPIYVGNNGDIRDQIIRTNVLIEKYNAGKPIFFRAPYGKWSPETANELNVGLRSSFRMCGPVHWDIPGFDCYYWKLGRTIHETVEAYVKEIEAKGKGVIVMHDEIADMDLVKPLNKTLELTHQLIPLLKQKGYVFKGLDELNDLRLKEANGDAFALVSKNSAYLKYEDREGGKVVWANSKIEDPQVYLTLSRHGNGKVSLQTRLGNYLSCDPETDTHFKITGAFNESCLLDDIPLYGQWQYFRTHNGNYLGGKGKANEAVKGEAPFMLQAQAIAYKPLKYAYVPPVTLAQRLTKIKKKLLFIKSKLF